MSKNKEVQEIPDSAENFQVEITTEVRHHLLAEFRRKTKLSQQALADLVGTTYQAVGLWEHLKTYPKDPKIMERLCKLTEKTPDELFPSFIRNAKFQKLLEEMQSMQSISLLDFEGGEAVSTRPSPVDAYDQKELQAKVEEVLKTLTAREEEVLRRWFGIGKLEVQTSQEIAQYFVLSSVRIDQIGAKALRKLRHPSRSRRLKDFAP